MRAVVTGATGFIGSRLAMDCLARAQEVVAFGLRNNPAEAENAAALAERGAKLAVGSVTDRQAVREAVAGADVVYHLAAAQHEANIPDERFEEINVEGARLVAQESARAGVPRLVHGSTIGVYRAEHGRRVTEQAALEPRNIYGRTKLAGERAVKAESGSLSVATLRISETYGPGDMRLLKLFRGVQKGRFPLVGSGRNRHHLIYIDDLVRALRLAAEMENPPSEPVVVAGPRAVSTREMIRLAAEAVEGWSSAPAIPAGPMRLLALLTEKICQPFGIQPPLHRRRLNFFLLDYEFDTAKAEQALGFRAEIPPEEGFRRTAAWYRQQQLM